MTIKQIKPSKLVPAKYNPRQIGQNELKRLAKLLDVHGFISPVIARSEDFLILGGHQRIKALKFTETKFQTIPVILLDGIDDIKAKAITIALNNTSAQGVFDRDMLGELLQDLQCDNLADMTGFSQIQLDDFNLDMTEVDFGELISIEENQAGDTDILSGECKYILAGDESAFTKEILSAIRKLVCSEGITLKKG